MSPEQEKKIDQLTESVASIKTLLVGNKELEQKGLVHDVIDLKKYKEKDEKYKAKIAGGVIVSVPVISIFIEWLKSKFT